tara:strand:+ start:165 stop:443 length:279 start_codon:yes stop_codon:yes gene_type:complete
MKTLKVHSMCSPRTGNPVANQFEIYTPKGVYFQSYQTIIAFKPNEGKLKLDKNYWDYSRTTLKYLHKFTRYQSKKDTLKAIENKQIILTNLN